jgi:hypothetical protein
VPDGSTVRVGLKGGAIEVTTTTASVGNAQPAGR